MRAQFNEHLRKNATRHQAETHMHIDDDYVPFSARNQYAFYPIQGKRPMSIIGLGMVSCLGSGAELNAAAMRCGYDGFVQTSFQHPGRRNKQVGAPITDELTGEKLSDFEKLGVMIRKVINRAITSLPMDYSDLPVIFCMPNKTPATYFNNDEALQEILDLAFQDIRLGDLHPESTALWRHRCGFTSALSQAQMMLYRHKKEYVLIVGMDSLLNATSLSYYAGGAPVERRLLSEDNSDGFIPGEAATAILLSTPNRNPSKVIIAGVAEADEPAVLGNEEEPMMGKGLAEAMRTASQDAGLEPHQASFRVASVSGESYFFNEAVLAQTRVLKQKTESQPLWHPADNIGEVGAAVGGAMVVMTYYAFINNYAPGSVALCHISNDDSRRGAFYMQHLFKES
jgi:3-oxoacyl-[acyl-carrier-protein] synthase I